MLGTSYWVTFVGGVVCSFEREATTSSLTKLQIMFKHLPRQMFGSVQSRLFPVYFSIQSATSVALLWLWTKGARPSNKNQLWRMNKYLLAFCATASVANMLVIGPWTTAIMKKRHRLERLEGTTYNAPQKSDEMRKLNKQFGTAHGVSSLLNLFFVIASTVHTAYIASNGLFIS